MRGGGGGDQSSNNRAAAIAEAGPPSKRKRSTDRTTRLLIVILVLFLLTEFPQVDKGKVQGAKLFLPIQLNNTNTTYMNLSYDTPLLLLYKVKFFDKSLSDR